MRIIKFRAWDKNLNSMISPLTLTEWKNTDYGNGYIERYLHLQQFTGLLDKNGKEIYSGDLIRIENRIYIIEWDELRGRWQAKTDCFFKSAHEVARKGEVIGDIMGNPELLK